MRVALDITVPGIAQTKGSWRSVTTKRGPRLIPDNEEEKAWAELIAWHARAQLKNAAPTAKRYAVRIVAELPPRMGRKSYNRDVDKLARSCLDALTGILWIDDEQVDRLEISKCRGVEPGMHIVATEITR